MSTEKSIAETGYTVFAAENGGVIVEGKGVNSCKNFAFSNADEFLDFLCHQYTGESPLCYYGPQLEKIDDKKPEPGLGAVQASECVSSNAKSADSVFISALRAGIACEGPKPAYELIHRDTRRVWRIYEDGRTEGFPEGCFIINRIPVLAHIAHAEGRNAGSCTCGSAHNHGCTVHKTGIYGNQVDHGGICGLRNSK